MAKLWEKLKNFVNGDDYDDYDEYDEYDGDDYDTEEEVTRSGGYEELPPIRPYRSSRTSQSTASDGGNSARTFTKSASSSFGSTTRTQPRSINLQQMQRTGSRNSSNSHVMNINTNVMMQVVVATPKNMAEAGELCEQLKERKTIIVNLEGVEHETAQRISDFLCGANYALDGTIQLISGEIFVICPLDVEISSQLKEDLRTNALKLTTYMSDRV